MLRLVALLSLVLALFAAPAKSQIFTFGREAEPLPKLKAKSLPEPLLDNFNAAALEKERCTDSEYLWLQHGLASMTSATQNKKLRKDAKKLGKFAKQNWLDEIGGLVEALSEDLVQGPCTAVVYYDPGKGFREELPKGEKKPRWPEVRMYPVSDQAEVLELRRLINGLATKEGLNEEDANALGAILDGEFGKGTGRSKYLVTQVRDYLEMMTDGTWAEYVEKWDEQEIEFETDEDGNKEKYTFDVLENLKDTARFLRQELIYSKAPEFPRALQAGRDFRFMGQVILRLVPKDAPDEAWQLPESWAKMNGLDHDPALVVQLTVEKKLGKKTRFTRAQLGILAGGHFIRGYDGKWPMR
jgi:hypothetical protein